MKYLTQVLSAILMGLLLSLSNEILAQTITVGTGGSPGAPKLRFSGDTNTGLYRESSDKMTLVANGQRALTVNGAGGSGKVGIKITNPSYPLHVSGDVYAQNGWLRTSGQKGLYSQSYGLYFYPVNTSYWRSRSDRGIQICNKAGSTRGYLYHNNSNGFGLLDRDGNWAIRIERDNYNAFYVNNSMKMKIQNNGYVGIGTASPSAKLHVHNGDVRFYDGGKNMYFDAGGNVHFSGFGSTGMSNIYASGPISLNPTQTVILSRYGGKVGIGLSNPTAKLHVNGTVLMGKSNNLSSVKVIGGICVVPHASQACPDYVFEPEYELRSIEELDAFLQENKHLPNVKSAKEIEAGGMNVVDMSYSLLEKVEELSLYVIDLNKRLNELESENEALKKELNSKQ